MNCREWERCVTLDLGGSAPPTIHGFVGEKSHALPEASVQSARSWCTCLKYMECRLQIAALGEDGSLRQFDNKLIAGLCLLAN